MKKSFVGVLLACSTLLLTPLARAQTFLDLAGLSPYPHYQTFETEHFQFTYQEGYFDFTERAATYLEQAHQVLSPLMKWQPRTKTHVLIADNEDSANGFAAPALRVGMVLIATPPDAWFATSYSDDWIKLLVFHEYTHILNIDPTTEWMEGLRILFGDIIRPNGLWPVWMLEGLAVYYETRTSKMGRGRSPYYEAVLRAFIQDKKFDNAHDFGITLDRVNGDYPLFPGGEIPYLFGYELWQQLGKSYSVRSEAESAMGDLSIQSSARVPFFIEGNMRNVTGKTWSEVWDQFVSETQARLTPEMERIKSAGVSEFEPITDADYSAVGGAISPDSKWLAYTKSSTLRRTGLYVQDLATRKEIRIDDKVQGVGLGFTPDSKQLIYSSQVRSHTYQSYSDLFLYDFPSHKITQLTESLRAKDPALSPDGTKVVFIKVQHGTHTFWTASLSPSGSEPELDHFKVVYRPKNFSILGTPKFLDATHIVFSEQEAGRPQSDLKVLDLSANESRTLLSDGAMNRSLNVDQSNVYYVSDQTGVDNVYRLSLQSDLTQAAGSPTRLTHVITGTILPFVAPHGELWSSVLTSVGYQIGRFPAILRESKPQFPYTGGALSTPNAPPPLEAALAPPADLGLKESNSKDYSPWSSLAPRQWAPLAYFQYSSYSGFEMGSSVVGFDSTGKHQYIGLLGYQFKTQTLEPFLSYTYYGFRPAVTLSASSSTFDIGAQGSTDFFYKQTRDVTLLFSYPIRWTYSSLVSSLYFSEEWNGIYDVDSQSRINTTDPDFNRNQIPVIGGSVRYTNTEQPRLGFMPERGDTFSLSGNGRGYDTDYALWKYLATYQHYFPIGDHSVLVPKLRWLGSSRTASGLERFYALAKGKRSGDITDRGTSSSLDSLGIRGYLMDYEFQTRSTAIASLNYHFPIDRIFRGFGTVPAFIEQAHGFIFVDGILIPRSTSPDLFLPAFGAGVSFDTTIGIRLPVRFNFEMQNGIRKDFYGEQNFFFSIESSGF